MGHAWTATYGNTARQLNHMNITSGGGGSCFATWTLIYMSKLFPYVVDGCYHLSESCVISSVTLLYVR
ncbi:hypothetical protein PUW25_25495 (plasmid) [Paenibacillus urinalis]|uniref:Uncharacterized protein n=1 Tax=Paenibacillus urinalis TaxID=521520 RepID=A0ABY7XH49_9BACL|nr:hypothetical protein [Paenibacillus urinalis]WDI05166.1 hypothetical protein PUW25_25495 [Paenibacillus urinalis]